VNYEQEEWIPKPPIPEIAIYGGLAKELTEDEVTKYSKMLGNGKCIQYNGTDIRIAPYWGSGYSLVIDLELGNNLFRCGVLTGEVGGYADNPSKVGDHIYITKKDGDEYLKFCYVGSPKWIVYNNITKESSLVDAPPPVIIKPSLSQQAKPLYENTLATYGSGYLWNKFTKILSFFFLKNKEKEVMKYESKRLRVKF
jgi:hypothetical protein